DQGSLVAAGRNLGLTPSAVSRALAELEQALGATLLHRSTRRLQLTEDGKLVYEQAQEILARLGAMESAVARRRQQVSGILRVGLPVPLGRYIIWPRIHLLLDRHPNLRVVCMPVQDSRKMQDENIDIMLTAGEPPPSRLVARRLALGRPAIYASAAYLRQHGEPRVPEDLAAHRSLVFHGPWMQVPAEEWHFKNGRTTRSVKVTPNVISSDREGMVVAAMGGAGLIRLACFDPELISDGRLQRVLPDWECTDGFNVYALYRRGAQSNPRIQAFLDFMHEAFAAFDPQQITLWRA
ncbi:MAG: LysR family transcriptional regulator, partial [Proteobacteria bacterium]|nr:LysR family transcriptional regulator [Pseudomonadota bacterium]